MSPPATRSAPDPIDDAVLAARLFALSPLALGGMVLRGGSPARDALVAMLGERMACRRLPAHIDDERLIGGIDIAASLAAGKPVHMRGLLGEAQGGVLIVPMAERMGEALAGRLAQALDRREVALVLLDDGREPDEVPPASLTGRLAFMCDLSASRATRVRLPSSEVSGEADTVAPLSDAALAALATTAAALGVDGLRAAIHAAQTARGHAGLCGRAQAERVDLEAAVRLVLAPRATQLPPTEPPADEDRTPPPPPDSNERPDEAEDDTATPAPDELGERLVEAATAAIPADLLAQLAAGSAPRRGASGTGATRKGGLRGKPLGARPGMPRGGARLALIDTLRAAVPWQALRRREAGTRADAPILIRKEDLRIRRFEEKAARLTIFAVDASGSAAAARLAEAKGAVELMLAQAYVTRSEVALVAFRGTGAELLLAPTRSLTRARRALAELPGGGGTPLALGLDAAREVAHAAAGRGRSPSLVVLTDGRANIDAAGQPGRAAAGEDAHRSARAIARAGIEALVVDISARAAQEGRALAEAMEARYLALPRADAKALHEAISATAREPA